MEKEFRDYLDKYYIIDGEVGTVFSKRRNKNLGYLTMYEYLEVAFVEFGKHRIHRLVWEYFNGDIPKGMMVDHISRVRTDNRLVNLRLVNDTQNCMNKSINPTTNTKGICFDDYKVDSKRRKKYRAVITFNKKQMYLGRFLTKKEALEAYNKKAIELFGVFAVLNIVEQD